MFNKKGNHIKNNILIYKIYRQKYLGAREHVANKMIF